MRTARVMPGQAKAARPNRTAQTPRSTSAHQLRARVASMMASLPRSHVHCESRATETPGTGTPYALHRASSRVEGRGGVVDGDPSHPDNVLHRENELATE